MWRKDVQYRSHTSWQQSPRNLQPHHQRQRGKKNNSQQVLCTATAGKQPTGRKYNFHLRGKAIWRLKLLHQLPATMGEEMVGHKALRSTVLHVKYLKTSIIRASDRTGYLVHPLRELLLCINVYTHGSPQGKTPSSPQSLNTSKREQNSLKYTTEGFVCSSRFCEPYLGHNVHLCTRTDTTSTVTPQPRSSVHGAGNSSTLPAGLRSFTVPGSNRQRPGSLCRHLWQVRELRHSLPNADEPQSPCLLRPGQDRRIPHRLMLAKAIGGSHREHHDSTRADPSSLLPSQVRVPQPQAPQNCR